MSKVKNVSGTARYVPLLDREVADGETVDVPDFQPDHNPDSKPGDPDYLAIIWPEPTWEPVGDAGPPAAPQQQEPAPAASEGTEF